MLHFIVNESARSGRGAQIWAELETVLKKKKIPYDAEKTVDSNHTKALADRICSLQEPELALVVVGGDGTMNDVLNGMHDFERVAFGMVPIGSGNDFGQGLGLPATPRENLEQVLHSYEKLQRGEPGALKDIDLGKSVFRDADSGAQKEQLFGISSGVGMDAIVCKKALTSRMKKVLNKLGLGKLTYVLITIYTIVSMRYIDAEILVDGKRSESRKRLIYVAAMNLRAEGGGVRMAPEATGDNRSLWACGVNGLSRLQSLMKFIILIRGKHKNNANFLLQQGTEFQVKLAEPTTLHADGEYCGETAEVTFLCLPGKLRMLGK